MHSRSFFSRALMGLPLALGLALSSLVSYTPAASADGPVRVLVVGDSITAGIHGDYTWRYRLWREFKRQGQAVDFVGSKQWPYVAKGFHSATYADPNFDHDHFATGGALLAGQMNTIRGEVSQQHPDVVVLASGLNDLIHGASVQQAGLYLATFIDKVQAEQPNAMIVVSPVLAINRPTPAGINSKIAQYDAHAADVVDQKNSPTSRVVMAATTSGWSPYGGYVQDGIHLTPRGDFFVAYRIAGALHSLGVLPTNPPPVPASVAWGRNLRPGLSVSGHNVLVRWDSQGLTAARIWRRRRWGAWHLVTTTRTSYTAAMTPGATYDFRIQGVRRTMTSTIGSVATIKAGPIGRVGRVRLRSNRIVWSTVYGATSYRVKYRRGGSTAWHVRSVRSTALRTHAAVAEVTAYNAFSSSAPTTGRRSR